jgi:hypothetical protein
MEVEAQNRRYRDFLFRCDDAMLAEERKREELIGTLTMERKGYDRTKMFYETHEQSLWAKIADLKGKVGKQELRNDYLDAQILEFEDRIES